MQLSIPKLQRLHRYSIKQFHRILYWDKIKVDLC